MDHKLILLLLIKEIIKWKTTPQLSWKKERRRRTLIKAFIIYTLLKKREQNKRRLRVRPIFST